MITPRCAALLLLLGSTAAACTAGGTSGPQEPAGPGDGPGGELPPDVQTAERPLLTVDQCKSQGGALVGDIGDGATHRPGYVCEGGMAPIGNVRLGVEGSVCCPVGPGVTEPASWSEAQCEAKGGAVVGDIGDGATGRPEYRCPSGKPSMARVRVGRDGGACCPAK